MTTSTNQSTKSPIPALFKAAVDAWGIPDLRYRILFTLFILVLFRFFAHVPVPGVDRDALAAAFEANPLLGFLDLFSGGALRNLSIAALGVYPYITASIILQILTPIIPTLKNLSQEGDAGRQAINRYTHYLTVPLAFLQGYGQLNLFAGGFLSQSGSAISGIGFGGSNTLNTIAILTAMTAGTMLLVWMGELVTEKGIGNGISLIIFAGIVAELPSALAGTLELGRTGALPSGLIVFFLLMAVIVIAIIVYVERAQRRVVVLYPKRQVGNKMFGGDSSHLPLKLNTAGVIPPIFASSLLLLPITLAGFTANAGPEWLNSMVAYLGRGQLAYLVLYSFLIGFFAFFYTSVVFNPSETADNLKNNGGFLPGIRPGKNTAEYLDFILTRLTVFGALYLIAISILPELLISKYSVPFYFGGTSLLIVVTVTMDTVAQVQSHLLAHQYEGLIKKSRLRGRRG